MVFSNEVKQNILLGKTYFLGPYQEIVRVLEFIQKKFLLKLWRSPHLTKIFNVIKKISPALN